MTRTNNLSWRRWIHRNDPRVHDDDHKTSVVMNLISYYYNPVPEAYPSYQVLWGRFDVSNPQKYDCLKIIRYLYSVN